MDDAAAPSILLVDDQPANLLALDSVLQPLGRRCVHARSGTDALRALLEETFAVVLLDVMMPELDGFETARLIRDRPRTAFTPIIFVTAADGRRELVDRAYGLGAVDYVIKPYEPAVLRAKVATFVTMYEQQTELRRHAELAASERQARAVAEAEARSRDEMIAIVSHELRTPLNAILGWAELLRAKRLTPAQQERAFETIVRSARAQAQLIEDLLDVSRIRAGTFRLTRQPFDIERTIRSAVEMVRPAADAKGVVLVAEIGDGQYDGDAQRIQQIALNLLNNAIKFTPAGGRVTLTLKRIDRDWELRVDDTGPGIDPAFLPRIFDRFSQSQLGARREFNGLGLGLAIVRHIVVSHGGTVEARSDGPGRGASFVVRLPATPVRAGVATRAANGAPVAARLDGMRILVVDDEDDSRDMIAAVLADAGALVEIARCVPDAMTAIERARFNAVVSDISMPGEDGWSFARRLAGAVPAIAVSALDGSDDRSRSIEAGFISHVGKPFVPDELIALVSRVAQR